MIDANIDQNNAYIAPVIERVGAVVDVAAELQKLGVDGATFAYQPGDFVDWSNGRVS